MFTQGNPYEGIQQLLRRRVGTLLAHHNGLTNDAMWAELIPDQIQRKKLQLRLCTQLDGGLWEWKPELVNTGILQKRAPKAKYLGVMRLFETSRLQSRCKFQYLAPANKPHLFRLANDLESQIYGFDILIRPIPSAGFGSESDDRRNDLHLGRLSFCIIIHTEVDVFKGKSDDNTNFGESFFRAACGDDLIHLGIIKNLLNFLARNDFKLRAALKGKKWDELACELTFYANEAAGMSFLT